MEDLMDLCDIFGISDGSEVYANRNNDEEY